MNASGTIPRLKALTLPQVEAIAAALDMDPTDLAIKLGGIAVGADTEPTVPALGRPGTLHHITIVAKHLGLDYYETHGLVEKGEIRASKIEGRTYISTKAVEDYLRDK